MRGGPHADVFKLWLYAISSLLLGVWSTPLVYNAGKALAEVSSVKTTNGPLEWLAGICAKADFPVFFEASLLLASLVLFIPFIDWIRGGRFAHDRRIMALIIASEKSPRHGGEVLRNPAGYRQMAWGFAIAVGVLVILALGLKLGRRVDFIQQVPIDLWQAAGWTLIATVISEAIFRGMILGILLRAMRPVLAVVISAMTFAAVWMLHSPPSISVADPEAAGTGFEFLRILAKHVGDPRTFVGTAGPLFVLGLILGAARWRTGSLWLPVGIHAGWNLANQLADKGLILTHPPGWLVGGNSLGEGLAALTALMVLALILWRRYAPSEVQENDP